MIHRIALSRIRVLVGVCCLLLTGCPAIGSRSAGWLYELNALDIGENVHLVPSGELIIVGRTQLENQSGDDMWQFAAQISRSGTMDWKIIFPEFYDSRLSSLNSCVSAVSPTGLTTIAGATKHLFSVVDNASTRMRIVRLSTEGNVVWDQEYGEPGVIPTAISASNNDTTVVAGVLTVNFEQRRMFVTELSSTGQEISHFEADAADIDPNLSAFRPRGIVALNGLNTIIADVFFSEQSRETDLALGAVQIDPSGAISRSAILRFGSIHDAIGAKPIGDGFVTIGRMYSGPTRPALLKVGSDLTLQRVRDDLFSQTRPEQGVSIFDFIVDSAGDIVMVGQGVTTRYIGIIPQITFRPLIAKFTADGDMIWETEIDAPGTFVNGVTERLGGGYATTGSAPGRRRDHINVILFDSNGRIVN